MRYVHHPIAPRVSGRAERHGRFKPHPTDRRSISAHNSAAEQLAALVIEIDALTLSYGAAASDGCSRLGATFAIQTITLPQVTGRVDEPSAANGVAASPLAHSATGF